MPQIKDALREFNPWWKEKFEIDFKQRIIYRELSKFISLPQIVALTGLRRVGKTTLMFKIIEDAIKTDFDPKNIVYFSFDEFKDIEIREALKEYEGFMRKDFRKDKFILLLDEIQKLDNWENQLKTIYDLFGKKVKIVISGSESLFIKRKSRETLAGRIFEFKIEPLTFKEFLNFKNVKYEPIGLYEKELAKLFDEFILTSGFPELIDKDKDTIKRYIKESIIERIIYRDLPELIGVKDISIIKSLFNIILERPGQLIEISELSKELGISRHTLSHYLIYLEESFLIRKLYNFSKSKRKTERKLKKYYSTIISPDLFFKNDELAMSQAFECFVINQLKAEFFWRDPYKNEVDAIRVDKKIMPIEIKYGKLDFKGLQAFMKKFKVNEGFIISLSEERKQKFNGKTISVIPAFKFFLK